MLYFIDQFSRLMLFERRETELGAREITLRAPSGIRIVFHRNNYEIKHSYGRAAPVYSYQFTGGFAAGLGQSSISLQRVRLNDTRSLNDRYYEHRIRMLSSAYSSPPKFVMYTKPYFSRSPFPIKHSHTKYRTKKKERDISETEQRRRPIKAFFNQSFHSLKHLLNHVSRRIRYMYVFH